jgi:HEAT repeat protein
MYHDPEPPAARVETVFPEAAKGLWVKALERPDAETRCRAAEAITMARRRSVEGLESTKAPLLAALDRADQYASVRLAVAEALVALDAREAAPSLLQQAQSGDNELRGVVEPALARWDYGPARAVWLARLGEPAAPRRSLVLAMRGLATVRETQAGDRLREMAMAERVPAALRLEAVRALGSLREEGLEGDAEKLAEDVSPRGITTRLAAVGLLHRHRGEKAVGLLQHLAADPEPAVAAAALRRLLDIDPPLAVNHAERLLAGPEGNPDAGLRLLAIDVLSRQPTAESIQLLGGRLDDYHADVRVQARRALTALAGQDQFRGPVIDQGMRMLERPRWQGQEQATILLTLIGEKPTAGREMKQLAAGHLVKLLATDNRPEVYITAAWGLRRLAVPETLPAVVEHVAAQEGRLRAAGHPDATTVLIDHQVSQLNQFLGKQKYAPADETLRRFIPRMERPRTGWLGSECRAAAFWALGRIHEGKSEAKLADDLAKRLDDIGTQPPEAPQVRRMAAIALGRMHAADGVPTLRKHFTDHEPSLDPVNNACGWAIEQVTGERMPPPKTIRRAERDWFLAPYE